MMRRDQAVIQGLCSPAIPNSCPQLPGGRAGVPRPRSHLTVATDQSAAAAMLHVPQLRHARTHTRPHTSPRTHISFLPPPSRGSSRLSPIPHPAGSKPLPVSISGSCLNTRGASLSPRQVGKQAPQERLFVQGHVVSKNVVGSDGSWDSQQEALGAGGGMQSLTPPAYLPAAPL